MAALITALSVYKRASREQRHMLRLGMLSFAAFVIVSFSLYGCGGAVSSGVQPPATATNVPPPAATGSATLSWAAPLTNVDGTPLTALGGYKVYYGNAPGVYTSVDVGPVSSCELGGLTKGQMYYFTVTAYDANGNESDYSTVVSKIIG